MVEIYLLVFTQSRNIMRNVEEEMSVILQRAKLGIYFKLFPVQLVFMGRSEFLKMRL